jgi:hypothetical protein
MASNTGLKLTDSQVNDIIEIVIQGASPEYPGGDGIVLFARGRTIREIQAYLEGDSWLAVSQVQ